MNEQIIAREHFQCRPDRPSLLYNGQSLSRRQSGRGVVLTTHSSSSANELELYLRLPFVPARAYHGVTFTLTAEQEAGWARKSVRTVLANRKLSKTYTYCLYHAIRVGYALHYKPEGRGFDSRWVHWNFSVT